MLQRSLARLAPSARVSMTPATNLHTLRLFSTKTANPASSGDSSKVYDGLRVSPAKDPYADILDPVNPPRLTYEHVKMLKNIDYSPVIERARKGDMFTVDQVLQILQEPSTLVRFLISDRPSMSLSYSLMAEYFTSLVCSITSYYMYFLVFLSIRRTTPTNRSSRPPC